MEHLLLRVVQALCKDVATPRAALVSRLATSGEWTQLLQLRVRPQDYSDSESYFKDCLVTDLLRKIEDLPTDVDREAVARRTFLLCEEQCAATNRRLSRFDQQTLLIEDANDERVYQFILEWRKEVSSILGNLPDHLTPRFSGGATYGDVGDYITTPDKMSSAPTVTQGARCLLPLWYDTAWARGLVKDRPWFSDPLTTRGNIYFTVPKDAEKRRGCAKEPSINVTYQLDVGRIMKSRLLSRLGIDLKGGQAIHQKLACEASWNGKYATIDMSNASDTLCRLLPRLLLRGDWYSLLSSLRSSHTRVDGRWHWLEKFSSMGNGFTFELETLVFVTLARQIVKGEGGDPSLVKCYGDDLIVPSEYTRSVLAALAFFGFTPNKSKTFTEGSFRESCGGDFFDGVPVRAHYLKELPDEPQKWISLANGLRRAASPDGVLDPPRWDLVRRAWLRTLDAIPSDIRRCRGPSHLGDIVIHDEESRWSHVPIRPRKRWSQPENRGDSRKRVLLDDGSGPTVDGVWAYVPIPVVLPWNNWLPTVQLASCTLSLPSRGITPRGGVSGYRIQRVPSRYTSDYLPRPKAYGRTRETENVLD
jgi:hypothetical protein